MHFDPPLQSARLIKRYKRFLADIELDDGSIRTIHCANTGAMTGCAQPNDTVWYSTSPNPKRKYPNSWELTGTQNHHLICVNTLQANKLAIEGINNGTILELSNYQHLRSEVKYGAENSRIDILLQDDDQPDCYVEVKSVTLLEGQQQGYFPDSVTLRGQKHLRELTEMANLGHRSVLLFIVLHSGIEKVASAHHIDADYSKLLLKAQLAGVEIICYKAHISLDEITLNTSVEFINNVKE